jgi:hypothetical protein
MIFKIINIKIFIFFDLVEFILIHYSINKGYIKYPKIIIDLYYLNRQKKYLYYYYYLNFYLKFSFKYPKYHLFKYLDYDYFKNNHNY